MEIARLLARLGMRSRAPALLLILGMALVGAGLEIVGVGLIVPLISLLSDPGRIEQAGALASAYELSGVATSRDFLILLSLTMGAVFIAKALYMTLLSHIETRFLAAWKLDVSRRLLRGYAAETYVTASVRHSAEPIRAVVSLVPKIFDGFVRASLMLCVNAIMAIALVAVIAFAEPLVVGVAVLVLPALWLQQRAFGRRMSALGESLPGLQRHRQSDLQQLFGVLKEAKVSGREDYFLERFEDTERRFVDNRRRFHFLQSLPPLLTEALLMMAVLGVIVGILVTESSSGDALVSLGLLAAGSFRLAPICNRLLVALNSLEYGRDAARVVADDLARDPGPSPESGGPGEPLRGALEIERVSFRYPGADRPALRDATFRVEASESVGLLGPSGAGKTTLADLILGLIEPDTGEVRVDGRPIRGRSKAWKRAVGYVPQRVYLLDDSARRNVAFGVPDAEIDDARVRRALTLAQMSQVVEGLPGGLDATLGENGSRLSEGERQRIGIARALYGEPSLLVLDEATSALDPATEREIAAAIQALKGRQTLIVIAHRRATLELCDRLVQLRDGRVARVAGPADLSDLLRSESPVVLELASAEGRTA